MKELNFKGGRKMSGFFNGGGPTGGGCGTNNLILFLLLIILVGDCLCFGGGSYGPKC